MSYQTSWKLADLPSQSSKGEAAFLTALLAYYTEPQWKEKVGGWRNDPFSSAATATGPHLPIVAQQQDYSGEFQAHFCLAATQVLDGVYSQVLSTAKAVSL